MDKISLIGMGTMGKIVQEQSKQANVEITSTIDPFSAEAGYKSITAESVKDTEVCVCFTSPTAAFENIKMLCSLKKHIVMATTGWNDKLEEVRDMVNAAGVGMIYSSNFSLGVNLFFKVLEKSLPLFNQFDDYDVMGWEMHHNRKADAPSGTAKTMEDIVLNNFSRKTEVVEDRPSGKMKPEEFHFASIRGGDIPGEHSLRFDSPFDSVTISHSARNRAGFAKGALLAASCIKNKQGLFTESDLIDAYLNKNL